MNKRILLFICMNFLVCSFGAQAGAGSLWDKVAAGYNSANCALTATADGIICGYKYSSGAITDSCQLCFQTFNNFASQIERHPRITAVIIISALSVGAGYTAKRMFKRLSNWYRLKRLRKADHKKVPMLDAETQTV